MSLTVEVDSHIDSDHDKNSKSAGRWTAEEHKLFLQGLDMYQKQWKLIADLVKTRTVVQIRTHAQKYFQKLQKSGWNKYGRVEDPGSPILSTSGKAVTGTLASGIGERAFNFTNSDVNGSSFPSSGSVDSGAHSESVATTSEGDSESENGGATGTTGIAAKRSLALKLPLSTSSSATYASGTSMLPSPVPAQGGLPRKRSRDGSIELGGTSSSISSTMTAVALGSNSDILQSTTVGMYSNEQELAGNGFATSLVAPSPKKLNSRQCSPNPSRHLLPPAAVTQASLSMVNGAVCSSASTNSGGGNDGSSSAAVGGGGGVVDGLLCEPVVNLDDVDMTMDLEAMRGAMLMGGVLAPDIPLTGGSTSSSSDGLNKGLVGSYCGTSSSLSAGGGRINSTGRSTMMMGMGMMGPPQVVVVGGAGGVCGGDVYATGIVDDAMECDFYFGSDHEFEESLAAAAAAAAGGGVTSDASSISAEESGYHYSVGNNNENNGNNAFTAAANTTNTLVNSNESGQYSTGSGVGGDAELDMNIIHLLETFDWNGTGSRAQSPYTDRTDNESSTASSYTSAIAVTYGATTIPPGGAESSATTNAHKKMCGGGADVSTSDYNNYSDSYSTHQYIQADGSLHSPLGGRSCGGMSGVTSYTNSAMSSALPSAVPSYSQLCSLVGPSSPNGVNAAAAESQPPPPPPAAAAAAAAAVDLPFPFSSSSFSLLSLLSARRGVLSTCCCWRNCSAFWLCWIRSKKDCKSRTGPLNSAL